MTMENSAGSGTMSEYERRRWEDLQVHWATVDHRRQIVPQRVRQAIGRVGGQVVDVGGRTASRISSAAPESLRNTAGRAVDAALVPTANAVVNLLDLITDWSVELTDPQRVLDHHRRRSREVGALADLRGFDLELLDEVTSNLRLRAATLGAAEGAAVGAMAFIPVAGFFTAITVDVLAVHVLTTSIATRVAHAYGFDPADSSTEQMIDRMVRRAYREQASKAATQHRAHSAFKAAAGRTNWSEKLRNDHRILAAVERLMKFAGSGAHVPVTRAAKALPLIGVVVGAGTNAYLLGEIANQSTRYAQTVRLATKHGLPIPPKLGSEDLGDADE